MGTFYTTIENQLRADGTYGLLYDHYTDLNAAMAKYYTICAAAAISELPYHSAHLLKNDGSMIRQEIFNHQVDQLFPELEE